MNCQSVMADNIRLGNKVRLLNQLVDLNSDVQVNILTSLMRVLEDRSLGAWSNLDARRMILTFLSIHHPHINIDADQERWENDRHNENIRRHQSTEAKALKDERK